MAAYLKSACNGCGVVTRPIDPAPFLTPGIVLSDGARSGPVWGEMANGNQAPIWAKRHRRMIDETFDFLRSTSQYLSTRVVVRAIPLRDGDYRAVYRYGVRGVLVPNDFEEDLRDILARAQSVLDIAMTAAVTAAASSPLTTKESRNTYFPIASTEASWKSTVGQAHMKALSRSQLSALRAIQPFVTGDGVISWFHKVHNSDKHESPLQLKVIPDREFIMLFDEIEPRSSEHWIDWVEPLPPIENRTEFVSYRCADPITSAGIERIPLGLVIWVAGDWRDIQHMLWDVMEFTTRASAILSNTSKAPANLMRKLFQAERRQLAAFKEMMTAATLTGSRTDTAAEREWQRLAETTREAARRFANWYGASPPGHY